MNDLAPHIENLHQKLAALIATSRQRAAATVNTELTLLYWNLGRRLHEEVLGGERAAYGARVIDQIGDRLAVEFGRGFEAKNLRRMVTFAQVFPDPQIVATLSRQLSWSHFKEIFSLKDPHQRLYYAHTAGTECWSVRELRSRIEAKTWERTALASLRQGEEPKITAQPYRKLVGRTITGVLWEDLEGEPLSVLALNGKDRDGNAATVAVLCDPEGNGTGHLGHQL